MGTVRGPCSAASARPAVRFAVALLTLAALSLAACSTDSAGQADEPSAPDGTLVAGEFTGLPKPADAKPLGDPAIHGLTIAQSFQVDGWTPQQVLDFYASHLPRRGWEQSTRAAETGHGDWRGRWARSSELLDVSASVDGGHGGTVSQLDLVLRA